MFLYSDDHHALFSYGKVGRILTSIQLIHSTLISIWHLSRRHPKSSQQNGNWVSHLVHLGTLWAPFRYPFSRSFLLNTQYLSRAGISASFLHVDRALSRTLQVCFVCFIPSANVAITPSTSRSRLRCLLFRGGDIRQGDFLKSTQFCYIWKMIAYQRSPPRVGSVGRKGPNIVQTSRWRPKLNESKSFPGLTNNFRVCNKLQYLPGWPRIK